MKGSLKLAGGLAVMLAMFAFGWVVATTGTGQVADPISLTDLEQGFTERMQNVVLMGHFTFEGRERRDGNPERYEISKVTKLEGDRWRFDVHLTYGGVDATLPVVVPMVWAGDTPMVTITDFAIPGLGDKFGARVIFYDDRYAGTWDHGEFGGLMYGTIESTVDDR